MTLERVTSAKETLSGKIMRVFTILNLYLYNSGYFSLKVQSLLIIKTNFIAVEIRMGQYTAIIKFHLQYDSVYLLIENSGCIPLIWFILSIYTDFNSRCRLTLTVTLAVDTWHIS